jgi:hypothetical protein
MVSVHSRCGCTLALSPICDTLIEGFNHFVIFMTAPIASSGAVADGCESPSAARADLRDDGSLVLREKTRAIEFIGMPPIE